MPEVERLKSLKQIRLTSAKVPKLISYGMDPLPHIVMTKVTGETCKERWAREGEPSGKEILRIGKMTGKFLAEMHRKTGGMLLYDDLHPDNMLISRKRGRLRVVDWGRPLIGCPTEALLRLLWLAPRLVPPTAQKFTAMTGIIIDPEFAKTRAAQALGPELLPIICANAEQWKATLGAIPARIKPARELA